MKQTWEGSHTLSCVRARALFLGNLNGKVVLVPFLAAVVKCLTRAAEGS